MSLLESIIKILKNQILKNQILKTFKCIKILFKSQHSFSTNSEIIITVILVLLLLVQLLRMVDYADCISVETLP